MNRKKFFQVFVRVRGDRCGGRAFVSHPLRMNLNRPPPGGIENENQLQRATAGGFENESQSQRRQRRGKIGPDRAPRHAQARVGGPHP